MEQHVYRPLTNPFIGFIMESQAGNTNLRSVTPAAIVHVDGVFSYGHDASGNQGIKKAAWPYK